MDGSQTSLNSLTACRLAVGPPALGQTKSYSVQLHLPLAATLGCAERESFSIEIHPLSLIVGPYVDSSELSYSAVVINISFFFLSSFLFCCFLWSGYHNFFGDRYQHTDTYQQTDRPTIRLLELLRTPQIKCHVTCDM